ncbi:uncharacterized protein LOC124266121 [Haliotis rubra]|uniref:uncharacterized protein LOC124266121 n=1 Tax=Haliotis rubra TaxID=36100 RepID=UPI001EE527DD|nr:uncharacterized protein LOC124266121 [Haliotis rubra]
MIIVNETHCPDSRRRQKTIGTRNPRFDTLPGGTRKNAESHIYLLKDSELLVYAPVIRSWRVVRHRQNTREYVKEIAGGDDNSRVYYLATDGHHYNISYYDVSRSNPTEPTPIVGHGRLELTVEMAVDDGAGLIFVLSVTNTRQCRLLVFKNKEISKNILLEMYHYGSVDVDRAHRKLYIAYTWPDTAYVGKVDYEGWVCDKIRLPGQYPASLAYDPRDNVVYGLVTDMGKQLVYFFDFSDGSAKRANMIPGGMQPNIILIGLTTFALIGRNAGVLYDRKISGRTNIDGRKSESGVILEYS